MGFTDNPIINSPFERPQWHYQLDEEGQPTGRKFPDRRESIQVVSVAARRPNAKDFSDAFLIVSLSMTIDA
jgi:type III restriction enzyme